MNALRLMAAMLLALAVVRPTAHGQSAKEDADALFASRFVIDDADPSRNIPSASDRDAAPLDFAYFIMNLSEKAEAAEKAGDHAAQVRYLRAIAAAVPERAAGFSKLCAAQEAAVNLGEAEQACGAAITLPGASIEDFARYVRVVFGQERELSPAQLTRLQAVDAHVRQQAPRSPMLLDLDCQLAIRTKDRARYQRCSAELQRLPDNDVKRLSYGWSWAMAQRDFAQAGALIQRAQQSSLPSDLVERMTRVRFEQMPWWQSTAERFFASRVRTALLAAVALCLLGLAVAQLQKRKMSH